MDPFDWTQLFIERCERSVPAQAFAGIFQHAVEQMGFRHFACCSHVDFNDPPPRAVVLHNYPPAWAGLYVEQKLFRCDPVLQHAEHSLLPFRWNTPEFIAALTNPHKRLLYEAAISGIADGYTVPIHLPALSRCRFNCPAKTAMCSPSWGASFVRFGRMAQHNLISMSLWRR